MAGSEVEFVPGYQQEVLLAVSDNVQELFVNRKRDRAKELAPKRDGYLADSIESEKLDYDEWHIIAKAGYSLFVEQGHATRHSHDPHYLAHYHHNQQWVPAEPFLRPALYEGM